MSDKVNNRLEDLYDVLVYNTHQQIAGRTPSFTVLERICINQERGSLYSQINQFNEEGDKRFYQCHPELEIKIRFVLQKIIDNNLITQ